MLKRTILLAAFCIAIIAGCSSKSSTENEPAPVTTTVGNSTSKQTGMYEIPGKSFIRSATCKFKVKDVLNTTNDIENIIESNGGFITSAEMKSNKDFSNKINVSEDSALTITAYTVSNDITLRIPNDKMDNTLRSIGKYIEYADYRIIKAEDVSLQLKAAERTASRLEKQEHLLTEAIGKNQKKLSDTKDVVQEIINADEKADNTDLNSLAMKDDVVYSTVSLTLYQDQTIKKEMSAIIPVADEYRPGFGKRIMMGFADGWKIIEELLVFVSKMWGLVLVLLAGFYIWKKTKVWWTGKPA